MKKIIIVMILMISAFLFSGCTDSKDADIYISVYPIEFIVKSIVKEEKTVESIYPRGAEVHDYEPTAKQIVSINECDILFYIGLGLEPFITNGLNSTFKDLTTVELSKYLELVELDGGHFHGSENEENHEHENESGKVYDSHVWLDPIAMIKMTEVILEELIKIYPDYENEFTLNSQELIKELELINNEYVEAISSEEIVNRTIMVDHDAYAYWTFRYGISRIKLRSDNESNEVGVQEFLEKINKAKEANIKYIISTKNETKSALFDRYITELNASEISLHHLGTITTKELKEGENYLTIMRDNLEVLKTVLPKKENE